MVSFCFLEWQLHVITERDQPQQTTVVYLLLQYTETTTRYIIAELAWAKQLQLVPFLTKHVDFSVVFVWFLQKEPLYCSVTESVSRHEPTDVSFQPAWRSPFSHSLQKAAPNQASYAPQSFCSTGIFTLHLTLGYHLFNLGLRALINPLFAVVVLALLFNPGLATLLLCQKYHCQNELFTIRQPIIY